MLALCGTAAAGKDMREFCDSIIVNDGTYSPEETARQIYEAYKQWMSEQIAPQLTIH